MKGLTKTFDIEIDIDDVWEVIDDHEFEIEAVERGYEIRIAKQTISLFERLCNQLDLPRVATSKEGLLKYISDQL